ncbi:MAG: crossover junction endodeoxyribonuclease RuvC [bacterium]
MTIIGIDPGTASTGWGIIQKKQLINCGLIKTKPDQAMGHRLDIICQELFAVLKKYQPDYAAVETIFFFRNCKSVLKVSQALGIIFYTLNKAKIPVFEYTPLQVKQKLSGYGRTDKSEIQKLVRKYLKLKELPKPKHASDALAIAICHQCSA